MTALNHIGDVAQEATSKFGRVVSITLTDGRDFADFYFVACKRREPAKAEYPFMTITARRNHDGVVSFMHGHYDLTIDQVAKAIGDVELAMECDI